jgi:aconitate hydratase
VTKNDGTKMQFYTVARLDSIMEIAYFQNKGILQFVLRSFLKKN